MIQINYRDGRPIYEQVMDGFRRLIISKVLQPDEKLPSVREIAGSLTINPNTIQRAYRELEAEGYIYTLPGKGCFVAGLPETVTVRKQELLRELDKVLEELMFLGTTSGEVLARYNEIQIRISTGLNPQKDDKKQEGGMQS